MVLNVPTFCKVMIGFLKIILGTKCPQTFELGWLKNRWSVKNVVRVKVTQLTK